MRRKKHINLLCLGCGIRKARRVEPYGYLFCLKCTKRQKTFNAGETIEITTSDIKEDRKKYENDIQQRYEGDTANLNYINKYGTKGYTPQELEKAKAAHTTYYRDSHEKYNPKKAT